MRRLIDRFLSEEFGNTVIDWTVFVSGVAMLAIALFVTAM